MTETQPVAITAADGSLLIMRIIKRTIDAVTAEQVELEIAKASEAWAQCAPELVPVIGWRFVTAADVPSQRDYRGAWRDVAGSIVHDMPLARAIHRDKLRADRAPQLAALDVEYQLADEREDRNEKRRIAAAKQALRDQPNDPRIDAATTIEELRALRR